MAYHLLIQSNQERALEQTMQLRRENKPIKQIFFYFQGIDQALTMTLAEKWVTLTSLSNQLKICKTAWMEKGNPPLPNGFVLSSLIDFFAAHWEDQGILLQL